MAGQSRPKIRYEAAGVVHLVHAWYAKRRNASNVSHLVYHLSAASDMGSRIICCLLRTCLETEGQLVQR